MQATGEVQGVNIQTARKVPGDLPNCAALMEVCFGCSAVCERASCFDIVLINLEPLSFIQVVVAVKPQTAKVRRLEKRSTALLTGYAFFCVSFQVPLIKYKTDWVLLL